MNKIRQNPKDHKRASQFTAEGYLYVQEKSKTCAKQADWVGLSPWCRLCSVPSGELPVSAANTVRRFEQNDQNQTKALHLWGTHASSLDTEMFYCVTEVALNSLHSPGWLQPKVRKFQTSIPLPLLTSGFCSTCIVFCTVGGNWRGVKAGRRMCAGPMLL